MSWRAPGAHALPDCIDCGYELAECVCVADFHETHGVTAAPDCDGCGEALEWCCDGWRCFRCDDPDAEREP